MSDILHNLRYHTDGIEKVLIGAFMIWVGFLWSFAIYSIISLDSTFGQYWGFFPAVAAAFMTIFLWAILASASDRISCLMFCCGFKNKKKIRGVTKQVSYHLIRTPFFLYIFLFQEF